MTRLSEAVCESFTKEGYLIHSIFLSLCFYGKLSPRTPAFGIWPQHFITSLSIVLGRHCSAVLSREQHRSHFAHSLPEFSFTMHLFTDPVLGRKRRLLKHIWVGQTEVGVKESTPEWAGKMKGLTQRCSGKLMEENQKSWLFTPMFYPSHPKSLNQDCHEWGWLLGVWGFVQL